MGVAYTILYKPRILSDDLPAISVASKKRIEQAILQKLISYPDMYGKPLRGLGRGYWKLRVGSYRVVYRIHNNIVTIVLIGHRSVVYKKLKNRF